MLPSFPVLLAHARLGAALLSVTLLLLSFPSMLHVRNTTAARFDEVMASLTAAARSASLPAAPRGVGARRACLVPDRTAAVGLVGDAPSRGGRITATFRSETDTCTARASTTVFAHRTRAEVSDVPGGSVAVRIGSPTTRRAAQTTRLESRLLVTLRGQMGTTSQAVGTLRTTISPDGAVTVDLVDLERAA